MTGLRVTKIIKIEPASVSTIIDRWNQRFDALEEEATELAQKVAEATDQAKTEGVNMDAFKLQRKLRKMRPGERADFIASLGRYLVMTAISS